MAAPRRKELHERRLAGIQHFCIEGLSGEFDSASFRRHLSGVAEVVLGLSGVAEVDFGPGGQGGVVPSSAVLLTIRRGSAGEVLDRGVSPDAKLLAQCLGFIFRAVHVSDDDRLGSRVLVSEFVPSRRH